MNIESDLRPLVADSASAIYAPFGQAGSGKSFHLPRYVFASNEKKLFFDKNLFYDDSIARIFYTGMRRGDLVVHTTNNIAAREIGEAAQGDFFAHYRDLRTGALCSYRPDFLIKTQSGASYIVELGDAKLTNADTLRAKAKGAKNLRVALLGNDSCAAYIFISRRQADTLFCDFLKN